MDVPKKNNVPRGEAATRAKNKYRDKNYDRMELAVPKGMKSIIEDTAKEAGYASKNAYIIEAIKEKYRRDSGSELILQEE